MRTNLTLAACTVIAVLLTTGCGPTYRFAANFDADTHGSPPDHFPAGHPNDEIFIHGLIGTSVLVSNASPLNSQSVVLLTGGDGSKILHCVSEPLPVSNKIKVASWFGWHGGGAPAEIQFSTNHFEPIGGIRFDNGNISAIQFTANGTKVLTSIGSYQLETNHYVELQANPVSNQFDVTVAEQSVIATGTFAIAGAPFPATRLNLTAQSLSGSGSPYWMDVIQMRE